LKFTKYRLAAGLRPDPLGELKRSPRPPSRNKGTLLLRGGEGRGRERRGEGEGRGMEGEGRGGKGKEGEGPTFSLVYATPLFVGEGNDHLQLIKFWPSCASGKGVCDGAKILGSALLQPARAVFASL